MLPVWMEGMRDLLEMSLGQPVMMRLARALISGSLMKACWKASFAVWHYAGMMDGDIQMAGWGPGQRLN